MRINLYVLAEMSLLSILRVFFIAKKKSRHRCVLAIYYISGYKPVFRL